MNSYRTYTYEVFGQYLGREVRTNYPAPATELFNYDADGNLTNDGRWSFVRDAENRLVRMEPSGTVTPPAGSRRKLEFAYDYMGRRIWRRITNLDTAAVLSENKFVYDGWNLCAEIDALNPQPRTLIRSYVWGTDLSGSLQGAGGVGGSVKLTYHGTQTTNAFVAYDGNGNVTALFDASNSALLASYEYGPFGEVIRATGPMAKANPFRFSTKYQDEETDLVMYPKRPYSSSAGRWLSRDPIEEFGGLNIYANCRNDCLNNFDPLGQDNMPYPFPHNTPAGRCPAVPKLQKEPKSDALSCCTPEKRKEGGRTRFAANSMPLVQV